jgi:hypothetical protein
MTWAERFTDEPYGETLYRNYHKGKKSAKDVVDFHFHPLSKLFEKYILNTKDLMISGLPLCVVRANDGCILIERLDMDENIRKKYLEEIKNAKTKKAGR